MITGVTLAGTNLHAQDIPSAGNWRGMWAGTNSYAVGDIVTYLGGTYIDIFPTAPVTAPLSNNLFDTSAVVSDVVISSADGSEVAIGGFQSSGYVNIAGDSSFVTNITLGIFNPYGIAFYDSNKTRVSKQLSEWQRLFSGWGTNLNPSRRLVCTLLVAKWRDGNHVRAGDHRRGNNSPKYLFAVWWWWFWIRWDRYP